jgi:chloramphenicol 3-O phosphotransferase
MGGVCIVLNGASSVGKTSIALALRDRWPGPLQVSGIDTFLICQSDSFFGDGSPAPGFAWVPTTIDRVPAFDIVVGPLGRGLERAAQRFWRACADVGLDQVVDDVWLTAEQALEFKSLMTGVNVLWVGVICPIEVIEQRERDRGDRRVGQARGHAHLVHTWTTYDIEVDTSLLSPAACASAILDVLALRGLWVGPV